MAYGHINVPGLSGIDAEQLKALINEKAPGADITRLEELINGKAPGTDITRLEEMINSKESGKRFARLVVGTSAAGWTTEDCDYLCDGTDDNVEILAAINALPDTGGTVVILDGDYNIAADVKIEKNNVTLTGQGCKLYAVNTSIYYVISASDRTTNITVSNLTIYCKGTACGIRIEGKESKAFGNYIYDAKTGICGSNYNLAIGNVVKVTDEYKSANRWNDGGIYAFGAMIIIGNYVYGHTVENVENFDRVYGIRANGICIGNYISFSSTGILLLDDSLVINNYITHCSTGIYADGDCCTVMGNHIFTRSPTSTYPPLPKYSIYMKYGPENTCIMFNHLTQGYPVTNDSTKTTTNWIENNWEVLKPY